MITTIDLFSPVRTAVPAGDSEGCGPGSSDLTLAFLPPGSRAVFVLFDVGGYTHEEIARLLGCAAGTSKSQLFKARTKLRALLSGRRRGRSRERRAENGAR